MFHHPSSNPKPVRLQPASIASLLRSLVILTLLASMLPGLAVRAQVSAAPNPIAPADLVTVTATGYSGSLAAPPAALPLFSWSAVAGANNYRLQISQDIAFTVKLEFVTPLTQFMPPNVGQFSDGVWYWRVRVDSPVASEYSLPRSFTRQWASPDNSPLLEYPADGAPLEFYNSPDFRWQHVVGASSYRFQVASDSSFSVSAIVYNVVTLATNHQPNTKFQNGNYYWRVIPINPANREGTPSEVRAFVMDYSQDPAQLAPANGSTPTFTPAFRWKAVPGAQFYRLQYSTDNTFNTAVTTVDTRNTSYTPTVTLPNNVNYYWRVRAHSNQSISDWSSTFVFQKRWYIKPVPLTPTNGFQNVRFPFFSWTPVPGAQYYQIQIATDLGFSSIRQDKTTSNPFFEPDTYSSEQDIFYWRVRPFDGSNREGVWSDTFSYQSYGVSLAPQLVYPFYYYQPNNFPAPDQAVAMQPYVDNTVAYPIFTWLRVMEPPFTGGPAADLYRLQLSTTPSFSSVAATIDTETANATLESSDGFTPTANQVYYWRVCPLNGAGSACQISTENGQEYWSQVHPVRFDLNPQPELPPTTTSAVRLLRPAQGSESVEYTPLFEWYPKFGADSYEIQIARDPAFSNIVETNTVPYPAYAPRQAFAQRSLNALDFGTYYWRVRGRSGGNPIGSWSPTWRYQIAAQSGWQFIRTPGDPSNQLLIGSDPSEGSVADNYELTTLYSAQDQDYWYFGFDAQTGGGANMAYALYLDIDHEDGSGATYDPRGHTISAIAAHRPEYVVYVDQVGSSFAASNVSIYHWTGSSWDPLVDILSDVGGSLYRSGSYTELRIPNTAIGHDSTTGSYAVMLASVNTGTGTMADSVPSDAALSGILSNFTSVSDKSNLVYPRNNIEGDLDTQPHPFIPPVFWEYPVGSDLVTPWAGAELEMHLDQAFTSQQKLYFIDSNAAYYVSAVLHSDRDLGGDDSFFWRERTRYLIADTPEAFGAWSEGWRFERIGFVPVDLQVNVTFATPTFSWSRVEGAKDYQLQVDTDPNFGTPDINITTTEPSYTPTNTLVDGTYYWRVRVNRQHNAVSEYTPTQTFTLQLPAPRNLTPDDPAELSPVSAAPTLCWEDLLRADPSQPNNPVLSAYRYRVEVSKGDPTFSVLYDAIETEQRCWTPIKGYDDGSYYWRVAMIDGNGRRGVFSTAARFLKQYPITTLVSPTGGGQLSGTPIFVWTPVSGAASYRVEVAVNSSFSPLYDTITTNSVRFTPTKLYADSSIIYWRVAIIDQQGRIGPFTDAIILDPNADLGKLFLPMARRR